jgi:GNAT superfamily N-acetyltransferase
MNRIAIKPAQASGSGTVSSILQEAANWLIGRGTPLWKTDELAPERLQAEVAAGLFWLAESDGEPVGCVRFQTQDEVFWPDVPADESAFIHRFAVRREFAGGTVSRALIEWAKAHAVALGRKYLRLDCEAKTRKLCQVYEKTGFRKHSERQVGPYRVARYECKLTETDKALPGTDRKLAARED